MSSLVIPLFAGLVINLSLLSLMLDFGLYEEHADLLNLPSLSSLAHPGKDKRE